MAGIDNITNEILQEAKDKAAAVIAEAQKKAEGILSDAQKQGEDIARKAAAKADADAASYAARIVSQAGMRKRQSVLKTKQDIISEVIEAAYQKLRNQPDDDYFAMILKLIASHAGTGEGEILFSKKDLDRMPKDFAEKAAKCVSAEGASIRVSEETARIDDGFILRYGGIDENCTLKALLAEKRDELSDQVALSLWHKGASNG